VGDLRNGCRDLVSVGLGRSLGGFVGVGHCDG
jgi:hypothetical protein